MNTIPATPCPAASVPDRSALVKGHPSFRGLSVEQHLLATFAMYTVDLDRYGLFISDSRPEVFNMAFEALYNPRPEALAA